MREFAIIAYLLHHKTQHYVVKWLYYEWMRYYGVFAATQDSALRRNVTVSWANALSLRICCNTRLNITSLSNCIVSECAIMAYLRQHRTRHYVVTWLYHEWVRYRGVFATTQDSILRRYVIVSWANAISVRTSVTRAHQRYSGPSHRLRTIWSPRVRGKPLFVPAWLTAGRLAKDAQA